MAKTTKARNQGAPDASVHADHPAGATQGTGNDTSHPQHLHASLSVDMLILTVRADQLQVLLVERRRPPFEGMWAIPGGFVEPGEDIETAARRELQEETGVTGAHLAQLHTFGAPHRDPRGRTISIAHYAFVPPEISAQAGDDAARLRWFAFDSLPPLAFDHADILAFARSFLRKRIGCLPIGQPLLPARFTLSTYLRLLEAIAGSPFERAQVRKRLIANDVLEQVGTTPGAHALYRFVEQ